MLRLVHSLDALTAAREERLRVDAMREEYLRKQALMLAEEGLAPPPPHIVYPYSPGASHLGRSVYQPFLFMAS